MIYVGYVVSVLSRGRSLYLFLLGKTFLMANFPERIRFEACNQCLLESSQ